MKRTSFLTLTLCLVSFFAAAQATGVEICNDGIDNDGDGFIDCYDGSCANIGNCDGTFLGNDAKCEAKPAAFPKFTMSLDFASPNETTNHLSRTAIGDLDRDGIPEIVTMNKYTKKLFVLNGRTGAVKYSMNAPFEPQWEIAIANIDNDNCGEIFTFGIEGSGKSSTYWLYSYSCDLTTQNWKTQIPKNDPINFGLADFDGDGKVELYAKDAIYNAHTGATLVSSTNWSGTNGGPVAVDLEGDQTLELVAGGHVYKVDLTGGTLTELHNIPDYYLRYEYNATSVADYNLDGFLDVIASGSTVGPGKNTTIFFWDVHNNTVKTFLDTTAGAYPGGWKYGTGRVNIADLDGDGQMNVSYVSGKFLYALDENLELFWRKVINEETSGYTGCTLFDFNGDGKSEIVYRDEQFLYIINGTDGSVFNQQNCVSRTNREYPIVADVDADGSTEMCVPCGFNDTDAKTNFDNIDYSRYSHIRVFKSAAEPWVPARRVWNQHGYFNVNVNDDLTIPKRQQKHHLVFSTGSCTTGPNRPLNGFLNQSPFLNSLGCPTYASPDLAYVDNSLTVDPPTCPDKAFTVSFRITNKGDQVLDGTVPISFYNGNPAAAGAVKLGTINANLTAFGTGSEFSITNASVSGPGSPFTLFIVLNDNGSTVPTPIKLPNTSFVECDYGNNIISAPVNPDPVSIVGEWVADNAHCPGSTTPNNGAVKAYVPVGATKNTTDYNFYWFRGAVDATPDFVGANYSGIPEGTYRVYAKHKIAQCNSDTAEVVVKLWTGPLEVTIDLLSPVTSCKIPDGKLKAIADKDGQPPSAFTFAWYEGNGVLTNPQIGVSDVATGLKALTYTVVVTEKLSGCQIITSKAVPSTVAQPVVDITKTDILCSSKSSGKLNATADGKTSGYKFEWYKGSSVKPSPDFTGASLSNLPGGTYTLVATNNSSKCESAPKSITIIQTPAPTVTATKTADMTSCDPTKPNGGATASVAPANAADFTFEWFKGTTLTAANKLPGNSSTSPGLAAGTYTVRATHTVNGCSDTDKVVIGLNIVNPTLSSSVKHVTTCTPYNGEATAIPSMDTPADYTFSWYKGTSVKATTDFTDTDNVIGNLEPGDYTVKAVHNTKFCNAPPITIKVQDLSPQITISLNSSVTQFPSDCRSADGIMEVDITSPGNTLGFTADWYFGVLPTTDQPIFSENVPSKSTATGLRTGVYTVFATDRNSGCSKPAEFDLPFASSHKLDTISHVDITKCIPDDDGAATVKLTTTPLPGFVQSDYDILVYAGNKDKNDGSEIDLIHGVDLQPNAEYSTSGLAAGKYTFVAVSNNPAMLGCRSVPKVMEIRRKAKDPLIAPGTINANTNCAGAAGTGSITLNIDGGANPANYSFQWFPGLSTTGTPLASTTETATGLTEGFYTVKVTNISAVSTGCVSTSAISVGSDPMNIDISGGGFTTVDLTSCNAATGEVFKNGTATVNSIDEDGSAGNLGDYTFTWTDSVDQALPGNTNSQAGLGAGNYFVLAKNNTNNCFTTVAFEIKNMTIGTVGVDLTDFEKPERCLALKTGLLTVAATGGAPGYGFEWYNGDTATGPVAGNSATLSGISVPAGDTAVSKTIVVINLSNNCRARATYTVPLVVNTVLATASASPVTNCLTDDGTVFGTVTNDNSLEYTYNWYDGNTVKALPDHTGKQIINLPIGDYTMVAVDNADSFCVSEPKNVRVENEKVMPVVKATVLSPLTNCDPEKANGGAEATLDNDDISFYDVDWFEGAPIQPSATPFFSGVAATGLDAATYSARATNRISHCTGEVSVVIIEQFAPMPNPQIAVLSNVTSCVLDNGSLSASVDGNTADYVFNWYVGTSVTGSIDFYGEVVDSLAVGSYTVTATSRITGCTTGPDTDQIIKEQVFPDFDFKIIPASCEGDNGFASLVMSSNVPIQSIAWDANGALVAGPNLENIGAGTYNVKVTSELGCATEKDVTIGTEIRPYNGISRNGDGRNEIFNIACIENFPGNNVKIFNRAGTLVYEGDGYNNVDIYFDGKSNRGVSPMGVLLPDGTYFYVIDKRDGSRPLAGYLEVVK